MVNPNTKLANYSFAEYARLFFNLDGIAGNGLKYSAYFEVRQDNGDAPGGPRGVARHRNGRKGRHPVQQWVLLTWME